MLILHGTWESVMWLSCRCKGFPVESVQSHDDCMSMWMKQSLSRVRQCDDGKHAMTIELHSCFVNLHVGPFITFVLSPRWWHHTLYLDATITILFSLSVCQGSQCFTRKVEYCQPKTGSMYHPGMRKYYLTQDSLEISGRLSQHEMKFEGVDAHLLDMWL